MTCETCSFFSLLNVTFVLSTVIITIFIKFLPIPGANDLWMSMRRKANNQSINQSVSKSINQSMLNVKMLNVYFVTRQLSFFREWIRGVRQCQASNLSKVATHWHGWELNPQPSCYQADTLSTEPRRPVNQSNNPPNRLGGFAKFPFGIIVVRPPQLSCRVKKWRYIPDPSKT